jgi:hypothetical protein
VFTTLLFLSALFSFTHVAAAAAAATVAAAAAAVLLFHLFVHTSTPDKVPIHLAIACLSRSPPAVVSHP